jgi:hypothetical protein
VDLRLSMAGARKPRPFPSLLRGDEKVRRIGAEVRRLTPHERLPLLRTRVRQVRDLVVAGLLDLIGGLVQGVQSAQQGPQNRAAPTQRGILPSPTISGAQNWLSAMTAHSRLNPPPPNSPSLSKPPAAQSSAQLRTPPQATAPQEKQRPTGVSPSRAAGRAPRSHPPRSGCSLVLNRVSIRFDRLVRSSVFQQILKICRIALSN